MSRIILNLLESGFTARSVGFETPSSGSWICILLSFMISHVGKSLSFDILMLSNIIQRGMEHVTSNGAQISYETNEQSIFTFLRSRTQLGVNLLSNLEILMESNFFDLQLMSKAKIHGKQDVVHKKSDVSCQVSMFELIIPSTLQVEFSFEAKYVSTE